MNSLLPFLEPIEIIGQPIGEEYTAYRMDGAPSNKPDMRQEIGLGTCHCCDYFTIQENSVILIEETRLLMTIEKFKIKYGSIQEEVEKNELIYERIREENTLKVYGSLLVLCHWAAQHREVATTIRPKKHNFWLVASDAEEDNDSGRTLSHIQSLLENLKSTLGSKLFEKVEVLTPSQFKRKLRS